MNWQLLWKITLLTTLIGYFVLVIIVFIGGLKDGGINPP